MKLHLLAAAALAAATTLPAQALLVDNVAAIAGPIQLVDFEAFDGLLTSGPVTVAPGVIFTGDSGAEPTAASSSASPAPRPTSARSPSRAWVWWPTT